MRWFMHMTDMHSDPFVYRLVTLFKGDGYMCYSVTLEVLAKENAIDSPAIFEKQYLVDRIRLPWDRITEIYAEWKKQKPNDFFMEEIEGGIEVSLFTTKIREIMDAWARRKHPQMLAKKPRSKPAKSAPAKDKPAGFNAYGFFLDTFKANHKGEDYIPENKDKDPNLCHSLYKRVGEEKYRKIVTRYHVSKDSFIISNGYNVKTMNSRASAMLLQDIDKPAASGAKFMPEVKRA